MERPSAGNVKDHYERLLARHYTWMFGQTFDEKVDEQKSILENALHSNAGPIAGLAVDLGSGPGYQSIALAQLGFSPVIAIDTSPALLDELRSRAPDLPIRAIEDDIVQFGRHVPAQSAQVIVCMGDTITHLGSRTIVGDVITSAGKALVRGGSLIITYRDLSEELHGLDRFIPVRSDDQRVMTSFLEFDQPESVIVHDLIYEREGSAWTLEKSCYRKLRLPHDWLQKALVDAGFSVECGSAGRLLRLVGTKT